MFLLFLMCPCRTDASETVTAAIPVICRAEGSSEVFTVTLKQETADAGQAATLSLKSGESGAFRLQYGVPGTYRYSVWQEAGTDPEIKYDPVKYKVDVYVLSRDNGELYTEVVAYKDGADDKAAELEFVNEPVKKETTVTPVVTGTSHTSGTGTNRTSGTGSTSTRPVSTGDEQQAVPYLAAVVTAFICLLVICRKGSDRHAK